MEREFERKEICKVIQHQMVQQGTQKCQGTVKNLATHQKGWRLFFSWM
jgi:hypothetical protein